MKEGGSGRGRCKDRREREKQRQIERRRRKCADELIELDELRVAGRVAPSDACICAVPTFGAKRKQMLALQAASFAPPRASCLHDGHSNYYLRAHARDLLVWYSSAVME
eukprot:6179494-Pleurochrysis_carterae.AAC.2